MLGVFRFTQVRDGIRSSDLHQRSKIKDAVLYAKQSKIRWAGHVMEVYRPDGQMNGSRWTRAVSDWIPRDVKRTAGRPPTRWSEFFTKSLEERYDARRVPKARRTHWATLARDREKWRIYWRPLESLDGQRDYR
uniref:Transposase n=1 Tax=Angiostrongylus cantonensis TaxID=6313 RepID=A0A0K0CZ06_ANGCA